MAMKRIIVCCDGTWNADDTQTTDTNVAVLSRSIHGSQGTNNSAYQFIAQNYVPGDEIYLFGFSRGAFTARSLGGLISACGILYRQSLSALPDAWVYYRSPKPHSPETFAAQYKVQCHLDPAITFLGVWDTVGSLGIPGSLLATSNKEKFAFHDTSPSPLVKCAVQALAIEEHRRDFTPTFWTGQIPPGVTIQQVWFAGAHWSRRICPVSMQTECSETVGGPQAPTP